MTQMVYNTNQRTSYKSIQTAIDDANNDDETVAIEKIGEHAPIVVKIKELVPEYIGANGNKTN